MPRVRRLPQYLGGGWPRRLGKATRLPGPPPAPAALRAVSASGQADGARRVQPVVRRHRQRAAPPAGTDRGRSRGRALAGSRQTVGCRRAAGGYRRYGCPTRAARDADRTDLGRCRDNACAEHVPGYPSETLHAAACHACLFAAETSCESKNRWLDRAAVVDLTGDGLAFLS